MLPLIGSLINKQKLVSCYLKKKGIDFSERGIYDNMSDEDLKEMITSEFDVKGDVNWKSLQKARKVTDIPLEKDEQKRLCKWLKDNKIGHWANGLGVKLDYDVKYIASLKSQGHYVGVVDMTILLGNGKVCYIELKRQKGGRVSEEQKKWIDYLNKNGYPAKVCKGCDEAIEFITQLKESEVNE